MDENQYGSWSAGFVRTHLISLTGSTLLTKMAQTFFFLIWAYKSREGIVNALKFQTLQLHVKTPRQTVQTQIKSASKEVV